MATPIETVVGLVLDGNEQPQFFRLQIIYAGQGQNPPVVSIFAEEADLRAMLRAGGRPEAEINELFDNV
jgi:hypothetical protein